MNFMSAPADDTADDTDVAVSARESLRLDDAIARALDVVVASIAIAFLLPLMVMVAVAITLTDRGPVLFAHQRIGRYGRMFPCLKFRSMAVDAEERLAELLRTDPVARAEWDRDHKLKNDPRITRIGGFLRRSSLDELPQLFNVLRGEMSIVGPRPIVLGEVPRYGRYFENYCSVRPGLTGLWQIGGRSDVDYRRRVAMDVAYTRHRCTMLNLRIMAFTVPSVLLNKGAY